VGALGFAQLDSINSPYNHNRKVIVFDTLEGFPSVSQKDDNSEIYYGKGDLATLDNIEDELLKSIDLYDKNRPLNHINKVELVRGDSTQNIPNYIKAPPSNNIFALFRLRYI